MRREQSRLGSSVTSQSAEAATRARERGLRNLGYTAGFSDRPPSLMHADDPVYQEAYRRGQEARKK